MSESHKNQFLIVECLHCPFYIPVVWNKYKRTNPGRCYAPALDPGVTWRILRKVGESFPKTPPDWCPLRSKPIEVRLKE